MFSLRMCESIHTFDLTDSPSKYYPKKDSLSKKIPHVFILVVEINSWFL